MNSDAAPYTRIIYVAHDHLNRERGALRDANVATDVIVLVYEALITLLSVKARFEESLLLAKYEGYKQYASRVGRMLPGIGRIR